MNNKNLFDLKILLKKLYIIGCRNLLVEGGNSLSNNFFKNKMFHQFYLFKSTKNLSKSGSFKEFNCFKYLFQNYKSRSKIFIKSGKDLIYLYKN